MRKLLVLVFVLIAQFPAYSENSFELQADLGRDPEGSTWYIIDYGRTSSSAYAVARKYYTAEDVRNDVIDELISEYSVSEETAEQLYFTEYRYDYTADGKQYSEVYEIHYDKLGHQIYGTISASSRTGTR